MATPSSENRQALAEVICTQINNPATLETLYREQRTAFSEAFAVAYVRLAGNPVADVWQARLTFKKPARAQTSKGAWIFLGVVALLTGLLAKLPALTGWDEAFYYTRNIGFIVFPALAAYFIWKHRVLPQRLLQAGAVLLLSILYINLLPNRFNSHTLALACMHLLLVLWALTGWIFTQQPGGVEAKRLDYLRYNADLVVMSTLLVLAGGILSGITVGLFSLIGISIEQFYFENIVVFALPSVPLLATHLTQTNPNLVGRVAPVIARIFSPLVLLMLLVYLGAIVYAGKDPYRDREFLILFNALLIGVMALIFFAAAETSGENKPSERWLLLVLSVVTLVVNGVALSAIIFRIAEWGFSPNRTAVLGSNMLMLVNLLLVALQLLRGVRTQNDGSGVYRIMAGYLPVYAVWAALVTFLFPLLFGFK